MAQIEFYVNDIMRKRCIERLINNDWKHCFVCGKPSDGEASQWHDIPLCAKENGNRCLHNFEQKLMELEAERLGLKIEDDLYTRIKPVMKANIVKDQWAKNSNGEKVFVKGSEFKNELVQGNIVNGMTVGGRRPTYIVVEHVAQDVYKQDYLALKDMDTNELIPLFDVHGHMTSIRQATNDEIEKYNVWL